MTPVLVLASSSPARRALLRSAGIEPRVVASGVDEESVTAGRTDELCRLLARLKASAVADGLPPGRRALVLGCDSMLDFDGRALGKPADAAEALARWRAMRGHSGTLHTGHCLIDAGTGKRAEAVASTTVHFADVTDEEIDAYVATGEPLRVAGGFTIDGVGGPFVTGIEGDHGTVVGLSLPLLRRLLAELGTSITELWRDGLASEA